MQLPEIRNPLPEINAQHVNTEQNTRYHQLVIMFHDTIMNSDNFRILNSESSSQQNEGGGGQSSTSGSAAEPEPETVSNPEPGTDQEQQRPSPRPRRPEMNVNLMQRMTDALSRMLNDPSTRLAMRTLSERDRQQRSNSEGHNEPAAAATSGATTSGESPTLSTSATTHSELKFRKNSIFVGQKHTF